MKRVLNSPGSRGNRKERGDYPPYVHFTLQKTNRDTQDALAYLARTLHVTTKDLSTAGTKDKRGVTVQRVALRRGAKTVEDVWKLANGVPGRKSAEEAVKERGERGVRVADFNYRKAGLELGMLKGNAFVITLRYVLRSIIMLDAMPTYYHGRNVQVDSVDTLDKAMTSIKEHGFINYYGMYPGLYDLYPSPNAERRQVCNDLEPPPFPRTPSDLRSYRKTGIGQYPSSCVSVLANIPRSSLLAVLG